MTEQGPIASTERVREVLESDFGVTVHAVRRQLRWRPTWTQQFDRT